MKNVKEECANKCESKKTFFDFFKKDKKECTKKGCPIEQKQETLQPTTEQAQVQPTVEQKEVQPLQVQQAQEPITVPDEAVKQEAPAAK